MGQLEYLKMKGKRYYRAMPECNQGLKDIDASAAVKPPNQESRLSTFWSCTIISKNH